MPPQAQQTLLTQTPISEIWGIGRHLAPRLRAEGIHTAQAVATMRPQQAQQLMGIHGRQLVYELQGLSCYPLEQEHKTAKSILRSRTFGQDTREKNVLEAAIAILATRAAISHRKSNLLARKIGIFIHTNRHKPGYQQWERTCTLTTPTNDTGGIIHLLVDTLNDLGQASLLYHRLGIFLCDFIPTTSIQTDILGTVDITQTNRSEARMKASDKINLRHGKGHIYYAENLSKSWQPKRQIRSPRYVSNWKELPSARIV